jgi:hypothetical protein
MQAIFVKSGKFPNFAQKDPYPPFPTKLVFRAYINITNKATGHLQHAGGVVPEPAADSAGTHIGSP